MVVTQLSELIRLRAPTSSRLALAIGRESNKVLVDYGILKAVPSVNRSLT